MIPETLHMEGPEAGVAALMLVGQLYKTAVDKGMLTVDERDGIVDGMIQFCEDGSANEKVALLIRALFQRQ